MAKTWSSHGPSNLFFLNLNQYDQGHAMPNLTLLGVTCGPLSQKCQKYGPFMAKTLSSYGPSIWFFLILNHFAQGCSMPDLTLLGFSCSPLS